MRPRSLLHVALIASGTSLVGVGLGLLLPAPMIASDITVTTTEDSLLVDGECSLREAILAANSNLPVDACPAGEGPDADVILLTEADAVYRLTIEGADEDLGLTGDLDITGAISIRGMGIIDAQGSDRAFDVHSGSGVFGLSVTAVRNGDPGGGDGGAIRVTQECLGGGPGTNRLALTALFIDNVAANGGALAVAGCARTEIIRSTFMNNRATGSGGAIHVSQAGHELYVETSTLAGNRAGTVGGAIAAGDAWHVTLAATTIADNLASIGGGIASSVPGQATDMLNALLARNTGGNCAIDGSIDGHHSLSDDLSCPDLGINAIVNVDARLAPLDATLGMPSYGLLPDSPAIDAGLELSFESTSDQRDVQRPVDGDGDGLAVWDIGSVEYVAPEPGPTEPAMGGAQPPPALPNTATDGQAPTLPAAWLVVAVGIALAARRVARRPA